MAEKTSNVVELRPRPKPRPKLDRATARALAEAGYMPADEYVREYDSDQLQFVGEK